jgi:formylglycine-generating enzyme required for sulfatase activity
MVLSVRPSLGQTDATKLDIPSFTPPTKWLPKPVPVPAAEAATQDEMKPYTETIGGSETKFDMVPIPGGKFTMGSPESEEGRKGDEGPQAEVQIDPFWMGKCEVTWDEYELWGMGLDKQQRKLTGAAGTDWDKVADAITMPTKPYSDMTFGMGKQGHPAICMTQLAAKMYCKWLSAKTGRYYRLPTEAEWEYACRAGAKTAYSFGDDAGALGDYAWYFDNSDDKYHPVGKKKPNPWGLYDMHGNVCEWVLDPWNEDGYTWPAARPVPNPVTVPKKVWDRVVRGGSWFDDPEALRSAARMRSEPDWKAQDPQIPQSIWYLTDATWVGFRVVRPLRAPTVEEAVPYDLNDLDKQEIVDYAEAKGEQIGGGS